MQHCCLCAVGVATGAPWVAPEEENLQRDTQEFDLNGYGRMVMMMMMRMMMLMMMIMMMILMMMVMMMMMMMMLMTVFPRGRFFHAVQHCHSHSNSWLQAVQHCWRGSFNTYLAEGRRIVRPLVPALPLIRFSREKVDRSWPRDPGEDRVQ